MAVSKRGYRALVLATLKMYQRNPVGPSAVFLFLLFFLAAMRLVNIQQPQSIKIALINQSTSAVAERLVEAIRKVDAFAITQPTEDDASRKLQQGTLDLLVVFPAEQPGATEPTVLHPTSLRVSHQTGGPGETGLLLLHGVVDRFNLDVLQLPSVAAIEDSTVEHTNLGFIDIMLPGLLAFNVVQSGLLLAAGVFAGYRASGILRRLQATGTTPATFVLAHATSTFLLGVAQTGVLILAASLLFAVRLNVGWLLVITALGYLVFLALGFTVSGWVRDPQRAPAVATAIGMPMIMAGLFPPGALPRAVDTAVGVLPIGFLTDAMRHIALGDSPATAAGDLLWLLAWAVLLLLAATRVFRWDEQ